MGRHGPAVTARRPPLAYPGRGHRARPHAMPVVARWSRRVGGDLDAAAARPRNPRCPGIGAGLPRSRPSRDSRFPESRDPGQIGMPDVPGSRPNRESGLESRKFPGSRPNRDSNPGKSRFFCSGQNRDCTLSAAGPTIAVPRRGPWVGKEAHRPMTRSRQRLHAPVESHTT